MAFTSLGVVLISTLTFVLGTFPEFQSEDELGFTPEFPQAVLVMSIIDNVAVGFFLVEYVVRERCLCNISNLEYVIVLHKSVLYKFIS